MANNSKMILISEEPIIPTDFQSIESKKIIDLRKCCMALRYINFRNEFGLFGSNKLQFSGYDQIENEIILTDTSIIR